MLTLNAKEIRDLAEFAGFTVDSHDEELDTEYTIIDCPKEGTKDDDGTIRHYDYVAYSTEYPEEGVMPLGDERK